MAAEEAGDDVVGRRTPDHSDAPPVLCRKDVWLLTGSSHASSRRNAASCRRGSGDDGPGCSANEIGASRSTRFVAGAGAGGMKAPTAGARVAAASPRARSTGDCRRNASARRVGLPLPLPLPLPMVAEVAEVAAAAATTLGLAPVVGVKGSAGRMGEAGGRILRRTDGRLLMASVPPSLLPWPAPAPATEAASIVALHSDNRSLTSVSLMPELVLEWRLAIFASRGVTVRRDACDDGEDCTDGDAVDGSSVPVNDAD